MREVMETLNYSIIEGYERALSHQSQSIETLIDLVKAKKITSMGEILSFLATNLHNQNSHLLEMKEFMEVLEELEGEMGFSLEQLALAVKQIVS